MRKLRRVCVFCGSNSGRHEDYASAARALGRALVAGGTDLVYGGGRIGLMGEVANAVLGAGGRVYGVIPDRLRTKEVAHDGLTELFVVESMHARKTMMAHLSDAFVVLPGGWGTLEETFEVVTWTQLGYHHKPIGLLNVRGYYDHLLSFAAHALEQGFLLPETRPLLRSADDPAELLALLASVPMDSKAPRLIEKP